MKNAKEKALLTTAFIAVTLTACGKADIQLNNETVTVELGTEISSNVEDYITTDDEDALEDITLDVSGVNTDAVGEYTATVTYGKDVYNVTVNVVDTTAPTITTTEKEVTVGDIVKAADLATADDLTDVTLTFEDGSDAWTAETAGSHVLTVVAMDANGNETKEEVTVTVKEAEPEETEETDLVTGTVDQENADTEKGTSTEKEDAKADTTTGKTKAASSTTSGTSATSTKKSTGTATTSTPAASTTTTQSNTASSSAQATTGTTTNTTNTQTGTNTNTGTTATDTSGSTGTTDNAAGEAIQSALDNGGAGNLYDFSNTDDYTGTSGLSNSEFDALAQ